MPTLSPAALHYVAGFDLIAIVVGRTGKVRTTCNPSARSQAWWVRRADARRLVAALRRSGSQDVPEMARQLRIATIVHSALAQRATAAVREVENRLRQAGHGGLLRQFNHAYATRREAARASGKTFMPYRAARVRLLEAVAGAVAQRGMLTESLISQVFE